MQEKLAAKQAELTAAQHSVRQLQAERDNQAAALAELGNAPGGSAGGIAGDADMAAPFEDAEEGETEEPVHVDKMTIQEIKQWLVEHGQEDAVFELNSRAKPRAKREDWVQLICSKQ